MTRTANWSPYLGSSAVILALVLLVIAIALICLAVWLPHPVAFKRPGATVSALIIVIWVLSVVMFLVAATAYADALYQQLGPINGPADPITPVTFTSDLLAFIAIAFLAGRRGFRVAVGSAIVGAIAAPLIFELPFDLIVMWRTYPPAPATLFTLLYFVPLGLIEVSSIALLMLSPLLKLSRSTLFLLAGMFLVFALWAVFGFAYPSTPLPIALNMLAKVLAIAATVSLFLPEGSLSQLRTLARVGAETPTRASSSSGLL